LFFIFDLEGGGSSRITTINMTRDRPDLPKLVQILMTLVADHIITEEMLRKPDMKDSSSSFWARATLQQWQQTTLWVPCLSHSSQGDKKDGCCWQCWRKDVTPNGIEKSCLCVTRTADSSFQDS